MVFKFFYWKVIDLLDVCLTSKSLSLKAQTSHSQAARLKFRQAMGLADRDSDGHPNGQSLGAWTKGPGHLLHSSHEGRHQLRPDFQESCLARAVVPSQFAPRQLQVEKRTTLSHCILNLCLVTTLLPAPIWNLGTHDFRYDFTIFFYT